MAKQTMREIQRDERGRIVLAEGELTGHAHAIADEGAVLMSDGERIAVLSVERAVTLTHEEHRALEVAPGEWEVRRQREHTIFGPRRVAD